MRTVGVDVGIRTAKAVLLSDGVLAGRAQVPTDWEPAAALRQALDVAVRDAGLADGDVDLVVATGVGKDKSGVERCVSPLNAAVAGARSVCPDCRTVIDLGAEGIRSMLVDDAGGLGNFAVNDKCASGAGAFLETMARILSVPVEQLSDLAKRHTNEVVIDTQCVVFAESEVISLVHKQVPPEDIVHAIHKGLANKISSIVLRAGVQDPVLMVGAAAADADLVDSLQEKLGASISVPDEYEYVSAIGAALLAEDKCVAATEGDASCTSALGGGCDD